MMVEKVPDSTYEMVGGLDQQIKEIKEVIELPVKHPELFDALGIAQPKGVLLYGPPGTGKTLLARAVAHHTDCKFIRVSGSELVQKYIGEGSRMVRELFVMAREHAPSIIFMDEIDSIGSSRGESGSGGGDSEVQRTMLELLNQLDGFEATKNIKVIMATNRIGATLTVFDFNLLFIYLSDILDAALLRPGRIDRKIEFPPPGPEARVSILRIHSRKVPFFLLRRTLLVSMLVLRCPCNEVSTSGLSPKKWVNAQVLRFAVFAQKLVCCGFSTC
jgi:26S proteasome regulatory subunit T6